MPPKKGDVKKLKPKSQRAKRALEARAPKLVENVKSSILMRGQSTSQIVQDALSDLHLLRAPNSRNMPKKSENLRPLESTVSVEFLSQKNDASLWAIGSHSKKRPHNLTMGRMYDGHVLDILEFGLENYKSINDFKVDQPAAGGKPCFYMCGDEWETPELATTKNFLVDFFRGPVVKTLNMRGLDRVLCACLENGKVHLRHYRIRRKKSAPGTSPALVLDECGPSMTLVPRRSAVASTELMKQATKKPAQLKEKKEKNKETNVFGETVGRLHMEKQDFEKLQTRKMKGLKRKFTPSGEGEDGGDDEEEE